MTTSTFVCRLFGGRDVAVTYDGTNLGVLGQSITISSLSTSLQAVWQAAISAAGNNQGSRAAFGGDTISQAVGTILDATPSVRTAVAAALATYPAEPVTR